MKKLVLTLGIVVVAMLAHGEREAQAACQTYGFWYMGVYYEYTYDDLTGVYGCVAGPSHANADKHIIYMHGRSMRGWPTGAFVPEADLPLDWNNVSMYYNGNSRISDYYANEEIKTTLRNNCTGAHSCVVVAYSSGLNRFLYALNALNAEGTPLTNLLFVEAVETSGGGTPVARYTSKWWKKLLAKLFGGYADVDKDLHDNDWQGGRFAYLQNIAPARVYHTGAGLKDQCVKIKILFIKIKLCGNKQMPGRRGDGAVPVYSQCGYTDRGIYNSCCDSGWKYSNRDFESFGYCSYQQNHTQMFETGFRVATNRILGRAYDIPNDGALIKDDFATIPDCNMAYDDCDLTEADGTPHFYVYQYVENNETSWRGATCDGVPCQYTSQGQVQDLGCYYDYYIGYYCSYIITGLNGVVQNCIDFGGTGEPYCY